MNYMLNELCVPNNGTASAGQKDRRESLKHRVQSVATPRAQLFTQNTDTGELHSFIGEVMVFIFVKAVKIYRGTFNWKWQCDTGMYNANTSWTSCTICDQIREWCEICDMQKDAIPPFHHSPREPSADPYAHHGRNLAH
jgi:hypothetical protein